MTKYIENYTTKINGLTFTFDRMPYVESFGQKELLFNFHDEELINEICKIVLIEKMEITNEILKFIRLYYDYSLEQMAKRYFDTSRQNLKNWEDNGLPEGTISSDQQENIYNDLIVEYTSRVQKNLLRVKVKHQKVEEKTFSFPVEAFEKMQRAHA